MSILDADNLSNGVNSLLPPPVLHRVLMKEIRTFRYGNIYTPQTGHDLLLVVLQLSHSITTSEILPKDKIAVTLGAAQALHLAFLFAALTRRRRCLILGPQYVLIHKLARQARLTVLECISATRGRFIPSVDEIEYFIINNSVESIFLTNPNNPSGEIYSSTDMIKLSELCKRHDILLIIDEILMDWSFTSTFTHVPSGAIALRILTPEGAIVIDSLAKKRSLSGVRIGYAIGPTRLTRLAREHNYRNMLFPPTMCLDFVVTDIFFRCVLETAQYMGAPIRQTFNGLRHRALELLQHGTWRIGPYHKQASSFQLYCCQIEAQQRLIEDNFRLFEKTLGRTVAGKSARRNGINALYRLKLSRWENAEVFATQLAQAQLLTILPYSAFLYNAGSPVRHQGTGWFRVTAARSSSSFERLTRKLHEFLKWGA
jgi:aspartate/methionine/tyrosine aminotransferase